MRRLLLAGPVAAAALFLLLLGDCVGLPGGCVLPPPEPVPRQRLPPAPPGGLLAGQVPPVSRSLLDRAIERSIALGYRTDSVIQGLAIDPVYNHSGLREYSKSGYKWLLRNSDRFHPNLLRFAHEEHPLRGEPCARAPLDGEPPDGILCGILQALYCDRVPPPPGIVERIWRGQANRDAQPAASLRESAPSKSSPDVDHATHALMALTELRRRGCSDPARVQSAIDEASTLLGAEMEARARNGTVPPPGALQALLFAGHSERISPLQVSLLQADLAAQTASPEIDPHDALLEVLVLAYLARVDPAEAPSIGGSRAASGGSP